MNPGAKIVTCPGCGSDSVYAASNPYRPFCSEKCKLVDLGAWASENFRLPQDPLADDSLNESTGRPDDHLRQN